MGNADEVPADEVPADEMLADEMLADEMPMQYSTCMLVAMSLRGDA